MDFKNLKNWFLSFLTEKKKENPPITSQEANYLYNEILELKSDFLWLKEFTLTNLERFGTLSKSQKVSAKRTTITEEINDYDPKRLGGKARVIMND